MMLSVFKVSIVFLLPVLQLSDFNALGDDNYRGTTFLLAQGLVLPGLYMHAVEVCQDRCKNPRDPQQNEEDLHSKRGQGLVPTVRGGHILRRPVRTVLPLKLGNVCIVSANTITSKRMASAAISVNHPWLLPLRPSGDCFGCTRLPSVAI